ncbi:nicotinate-nucleotide/dimethylbenzimidazolephosp horibosyltransferase [Desulfarculus baarsii DSM 2075]|uniref:Nicotinate-nucleotide--dimethylbenzimidazole phosphoribosyltransferase n=1 Tax=Desulfarculus baarsii (strain ATCC 33931 / DSM 2075 / LMG 7858 / VKM B-1802 / 2st14) TaxID=644282 RepID=E1QH53_DESB2|nr:nicotinate-nucleotide--dimethylbenzimidazole phosphoribosyltransferase [Desulfarculus baarsii]ADK84896.1 nicotinate-nucleotide/dimethylbenzimidazolephosp horibosyltransferase [Desulfarculus baarsii DSM 2075]
MDRLENIINRVKLPDYAIGQEAQRRLDSLTKPQGSLGRLEDIAKQLCIIRGGAAKLAQPKPAAAVFAADHGVAAGGVSAYPQEVTQQMIYNFLAGGAGINVLCRQAGADVWVIDVGVAGDMSQAQGLIQAKVAHGTADMTKGPVMTMNQALDAIVVGAQTAQRLIEKGYDLLIPGEMGIGNTTPCSAITAVICGLRPEQVMGRGTGVDDAGLSRKLAALKTALDVNKPDPANPLEVLCKVGGLEIAAMCGYILEAAARGVPVMLDGFISTTAALVAGGLCPTAIDYCFSGHGSVEIGHRAQLEKLGLRPILTLEMRLGEGTGAAVAMNVLRAAVAIYSEMATFAEAGVTGH